MGVILARFEKVGAILASFEKVGVYIGFGVVLHSIHHNSVSAQYLDRISPNFVYAMILTRSRLGLLHVSFHTFVPELWPLIYAKIWFRSISSEQINKNFTKFCICIDIYKIQVLLYMIDMVMR